jgi:predicted dehydrogenase
VSKLKVGIAGNGVVGQVRRRHIDAHPCLTTVAVCDQRFSQNTFTDGIHCFPHYSQLLEQRLDVLFVCLPNYLASEVTIAALDRGLHVFCEKPPGRNLQDIVDVMECERRHPELKLMYGFNHRYHDSVRDALAITCRGDLGRVLNMRGMYGKSKIIRFDSDWRTKRSMAGGGILLDQGIHMVDMMRLFAGEFVDVQSYVSNSYWNHDVEDNAYALMRTADGIVAMLHSSATQWRHRFSLEITYARGAIILSGLLSGSKSYGAETITVAHASQHDDGDPLEQSTRYNEDHSWAREVEAFAQAILNDTPVASGSSLDALKTMELVYRVYCADPVWKATYQLTDSLPESVR